LNKGYSGNFCLPGRFALLRNAAVRIDNRPDRADGAPISAAGIQAARMEIASWPGYEPTPLRQLSGMANACGISDLFYKDEDLRFGLQSFKALGGAYAVCRLLQAFVAAKIGVLPTSQDLREGKYRDLTKSYTVTTATDGNHGRSVAWGAKSFGCSSLVYVPRQCSKARQVVIESYGAQVRQTNSGYDETVALCSENAERHGYIVVSDTSWEGYNEIPATIMQGYTVMSGEAIEQLGNNRIPTHVFIQAGVGGLAAAVDSHFGLRWGLKKPCAIVVEPEGAACLYASALAGKPSRARGEVQTIMAGLDCGEPSLLAWSLLAKDAKFFATVTDSAAVNCMKLLADSPFGDDPIVAGESAVAGLAALLCVTGSADMRQKLNLTSQSRVLLFGTEGDTDPSIYERFTGQQALDVRKRGSEFRS
jgi:diaminopropionate ammonia-lyase